MPTEEKHQCEFTGHIYKSEAPGSFEKKKKKSYVHHSSAFKHCLY